MFEWLKKMIGRKKADPELSGKETEAALPPQREKTEPDRTEQKAEQSLLTKPCKECGKAIPYDPAWRHLPNFCAECREKYRQKMKAEKKPEKPVSESAAVNSPETGKKDYRKMIRRKCKSCGRSFTFPATVPHWPRYCRECRKNYRREQA